MMPPERPLAPSRNTHRPARRWAEERAWTGPPWSWGGNASSRVSGSGASDPPDPMPSPDPSSKVC